MRRGKENREKQLLKYIPDVLDHETLLYIGARRGATQMLNLFVDASYTIDIIEIWPENVCGLKDMKGIRRITQGDVRDISKMNFALYDVVMWWHGPEHVHWRELEKTLNDLKELSKKITIVACPLGVCKQGGKRDNIHERHLISLYPEIFEGFGWKTNTLIEKTAQRSNLLAWSKNEQ